MAAPEILTTFDGSLVGAINGTNVTFSGAALAQPGMVFLNGVLLTKPYDFVSQLNVISLNPENTPVAGNVVTEAVYGYNDQNLPFNTPTQFTTTDGSIIGLLNGANNLFTLRTTGLVTEILLFWNGLLLTLNGDYVWTSSLISSAGGWTTAITLNDPRHITSVERLTAQVWTT